jgi:hypothetical protein
MGIPLWEPECGRGMPDWEGVRRVALPGAGSRLARRGWRKGVVIFAERYALREAANALGGAKSKESSVTK